MRRSFWVALGLGAGATGAIVASRWTKRQAKKVAPATIAREARGGLLDLSKLVSESIAEGRRAMADREEELRTELLGDPPAREPAHPVAREPAAVPTNQPAAVPTREPEDVGTASGPPPA